MTNKIDYGFGAKNNWRRRVWNTTSKMLSFKKRKAVCLYLANETDIDFQIATQKGFDPNNLIAVNKDKKIVENIRKKKRLAFCGDIFDAARNWPENMDIDFLHLDLCTGLQNRVLETPWNIISGKLSPDAVICVNLQRGRDSQTNEFRDKVINEPNIKSIFGDVEKHRGKLFFISLISWLAHFAKIYSAKNGDGEIDHILISLEPNNDGLYWARFQTWVKLFNNPVFLTYKSKDNRNSRHGVTMDSVIFQMPFQINCEAYSEPTNDKAKNSLKAISAWRTMRK